MEDAQTEVAGRHAEPVHALQADVAVVGGGLAGLTLGLALSSANIGVVVIERTPAGRMSESAFDGRSSAIAYASARLLEAIGVWERLAPLAQPIHDIRIADGNLSGGISRLFLHYDHRAVGDAPFGYMLENRDIRRVLFAAAASQPRLQVLAPASVVATERHSAAATLTLADGRTLRVSLLVAADGANSRLRRGAGIRSVRRQYRQTSIACTVAHDAHDHEGVAVELFLPGGPFAMLPLTGRRTSIVWTEKAHLADRYVALSDAAFLEEVARRFGDWLGPLRLTGPRFAYPLQIAHAERYVEHRLALVGEAAHVIHPVAGQGLNLGLRDAAALAEVVVEARRLGLDIGDVAVLQRYQRWRRSDNLVLAAVTDGLTQLFSNDIAPLRLARDLGLAAVERLPPVKRFLMRHAMGVVGDLPRLLQGRPL